MKHLSLKVISQQTVAEGFFEIVMQWPQELPAPLPGQFFTVRVTEGPSPLLRRPFAFSGYQKDSQQSPTVSCIYQRRGPATRLLTAAQAGDSLDILAPLGSAFPVDQCLDGRIKNRPVLLAGGVGIGPMLYTAECLRGAGPLLVIGARSKQLLPLTAIPEGIETVLCTDDGSLGIKGTVLQALEQRNTAPGIIMACGPNAMLAAAKDWASQRSLPCYVSMEQTMGCAVGACMGCVVPVHGGQGGQGFARVCIEGPVFDAEAIDWEVLANA